MQQHIENNPSLHRPTTLERATNSRFEGEYPFRRYQNVCMEASPSQRSSSGERRYCNTHSLEKKRSPYYSSLMSLQNVNSYQQSFERPSTEQLNK